MTDAPCVYRLGPPSDDLGPLAEFLKASPGAAVTITVDPARALGTPELQLLLAARQDPAGPSALVLEPMSPRLAAGLALLGLDGHLGVAA